MRFANSNLDNCGSVGSGSATYSGLGIAGKPAAILSFLSYSLARYSFLTFLETTEKGTIIAKISENKIDKTLTPNVAKTTILFVKPLALK